MDTKLRVAIVHDWLTNQGGAERVVASLIKAYPQADLYTSVYRLGSVPALKNQTVKTSFLQNWPLATTKHQLYPTLRPLAFESFDFTGYDLVISSASAESKGVITPTETLHVSYIHTPTRYYWSHYHEYLRSPGFGPLNPLVQLLLPGFVRGRRRWDYAAAQRPDVLVANSREVQKRIKKYYKRSSLVVNPPVDISRFSVSKAQDGDYFLVVSRLIPYKRVDLAILACKRLGKKLIIAGTGPESKKLKSLADHNIEFIERPTDAEVTKLYLGCKAFIFTAEEDFGITPVEAMAAGKPVVAYGHAGSAETVIDGQTGIHFDRQTVEDVADAISALEKRSWDATKIRSVAEQYSEERFIKAIHKIVDEARQKKN